MKENPLGKYNTLGLRGPVNPIEHEKVAVFIAGSEDLQTFKDLRVESIHNDPEAYNLTDSQKQERKIQELLGFTGEDIASDSKFVIMSKYDTKPIGLVGARKTEEGAWIIHSVYLAPEFRKSFTNARISEEMLQKALMEIKHRGGRQVYLWVENTRQHAIDLYKKLGFKPSKELGERWRRLIKKDHGLMEMSI